MSLSFDLIADRQRRKARARRWEQSQRSLLALALTCLGIAAFSCLCAYVAFGLIFFPN